MNDKALDLLANNIALNGYKRLIVRKFSFLKNDNLLKTIIDENNYKCLKCDSIFLIIAIYAVNVRALKHLSHINSI